MYETFLNYIKDYKISPIEEENIKNTFVIINKKNKSDTNKHKYIYNKHFVKNENFTIKEKTFLINIFKIVFKL